MKNNRAILYGAALWLGACATDTEIPFYEKDYALPTQAREWAATASLADLCQGTKNWRHEHIRDAALNEIHARNIDTRQCYYNGLELTP